MNSTYTPENFNISIQTPTDSDIFSNNSKDPNIDESNFSIYNDNFTNSNSEGKKTKKSVIRARFSRQEDKELIRLVSLYGNQDWKKISSELSKQSSNNIKRSPRQCKDRYVNYLSPEINKGEWTVEEDQLLMFNFMLTVPHFKIMKQLFPGRSEAAIKNRFKHLYKFGLGLLKSKIENNIPKDDQNLDSQNQNSNGSLPNSCGTSNQLLNNFNLNFGPIYSNYCKSAVLNIFKNSPPVLKAIQNNHLRINQRIFPNPLIPPRKNLNNANETNHENNMSMFTNQIASRDPFQLESDSESFDSLHWFEMFQ